MLSSHAARLDHRQRYATTRFIQFQHPYLHNLPNGHHIVRISHVATRQLTDVHHATVVQADVNKSPKVNDVEDRTHEFHSHLKILQLEHALLKERLRQVLAGIPTWASKLLDDVR